MDKLLRSIELEFTILEFYDNYVVSRVKEGVVFSKKQVLDLVEVCSDFYRGKKFVYISRRENNYNVDPTIYYNIEKVKNLAGIAIVSTNPSSLSMANFEKEFSKIPFALFLEMDDALKWVREVTKNKKAGL